MDKFKLYLRPVSRQLTDRQVIRPQNDSHP